MRGDQVALFSRVKVMVALLLFVASEACGAEGAASSAGSPSFAAHEAQVEGCVPVCGAGGRLDPIPLPEGEYQTEGFFGGAMKVTFDSGWTSPEDSSGEFAATPDDGAGGVLFWLDVYPVERFERVQDVPLTTDALVEWLRTNPDLDVSAPVAGSIGALPATIVDVRLSADARNESLADSLAAGLSREDINFCRHDGRVCSFFLGFPQWYPEPGVWGIGVREEVQRLYLSDVTYGDEDHLFVAVVYANPARDQMAMLDAGQRVIDTVRVPVTPN